MSCHDIGREMVVPLGLCSFVGKLEIVQKLKKQRKEPQSFTSNTIFTVV